MQPKRCLDRRCRRAGAGDRAAVEELARQSPSHVGVTILDLGYSTSQRHGGLSPSHCGGALKTILSHAAKVNLSRYVPEEALPGKAVWRRCVEHDACAHVDAK